MIKTELPIGPNNSYIVAEGNKRQEDNSSVLKRKAMYHFVPEALRKHVNQEAEDR